MYKDDINYEQQDVKTLLISDDDSNGDFIVCVSFIRKYEQEDECYN